MVSEGDKTLFEKPPKLSKAVFMSLAEMTSLPYITVRSASIYYYCISKFQNHL